MDVPSNEVVAAGLSMPHSPRWHGGRLWVLESGKGELCPSTSTPGGRETVVELPGFTRGLAFAGSTAFVGLSQIRESATFGDLPLIERLQERLCGVWMVDLDERRRSRGSCASTTSCRRSSTSRCCAASGYPEIAEPGSSAVATSYVLP